MSKASEWAGRLGAATDRVRVARDGEPTPFVWHLVGAAMLSIRVDDDGRAVVGITGITKDFETTVYSDHDHRRLLELARWILDTFGDANSSTVGSGESVTTARDPQGASGPTS